MVLERTPINPPLSCFCRILNLQNRPVAAQFDSCYEWLKRHCHVLYAYFLNKMTCKTSYLLLLYLSATLLASFGQKQASSRNFCIHILKCTRWTQIPLNPTSPFAHFGVAIPRKCLFFHEILWMIEDWIIKDSRYIRRQYPTFTTGHF